MYLWTLYWLSIKPVTLFIGIFVDNAIAIVASPPWTASQIEGYLERAVEDVLQVGLTSVHDAASLPEYIDAFAKYELPDLSQLI